jgi:hypothetical protein
LEDAVNHAGFRDDHDEAVALALMCPNDDLQRGRVQEGAASQIDHQKALGAQIGFGALYGGLKIFRVGDVDLAGDVQCDDRVKIFAYKSRALI